MSDGFYKPIPLTLVRLLGGLVPSIRRRRSQSYLIAEACSYNPPLEEVLF